MATATSRCASKAPFEGSFRQRRAATLRLVADAERRVADLDPDAVESLARDGLVLRLGRHRLPTRLVP